MSVVKGFKNQFRSVIHWDDPDPDMLFYKFTANGDEIKNLSKLIIGPGQGAVLVYEGKVEAILTEEGSTDIKTENKPFITTLKKIMQRFESEHKTGVWYYRRADILNCRWGTVTPIKYLDPSYKFPVGLSAFGNYSVRIRDVDAFFRNVVAGESYYTTSELRTLILSRMGQPLTDYLANAKFSYLDLDAHRSEIAAEARAKTENVFEDFGFELLDFRVEGTNFDDATLERIGKIADMTAENLAAKEVGLSYTEAQQVEALRDAARNEGGLAGAGVQMGAGLSLGQALTGVAGASAGQAAPVTGEDDITAKLQKLKTLFDGGLIDEDEFKAKKAALLEEL